MLLIIQPGQKLPSLAAVPGDFGDWILAGMGPLNTGHRVVRVHEGQSLPAHDEVTAVAVTGSSAMVTDASDWIESSAAWLREAVLGGLPVLGICFGHQLLAHALGGQVDDNPAGLEVGTVTVDLLAAAQQDPLFRDMPVRTRLQLSHRQSVLDLPPGARHLARSDRDRHQAFAWGDRAWGVQFHPEFSAAIVRGYVEHYTEVLREEGRDAGELQGQVAETEQGALLLQRYAVIAGISGAVSE